MAITFDPRILLRRLWPGCNSQPAQASRGRRVQLELENLEHRLLLSIRPWTGFGSDHNWLTPTNWQGNVAPSPGDYLVFPLLNHPTINNNFSAGTVFNSITISNG